MLHPASANARPATAYARLEERPLFTEKDFTAPRRPMPRRKYATKTPAVNAMPTDRTSRLLFFRYASIDRKNTIVVNEHGFMPSRSAAIGELARTKVLQQQRLAASSLKLEISGR